MICAKCGTEIHPGDAVELIFDGDEPPRIATSDDMLVVHAVCPELGDGG